jgi:vacuolar-type H+-ATPase subunit H
MKRVTKKKTKECCGEEINCGKSYKEYLKEYKRKTRGDRRKIMKQARDTIKKIRASENYSGNLKTKDFDFDFF